MAPHTPPDGDPAPGLVPEVAELDLGRASRRGYPEAVYGQGKTREQLVAIARSYAENRPDSPVLFTRLDPADAEAVQQILTGSRYDPTARLLAWPADPPAPRGGLVVVACAGTSDLPVGQEAALTARHLGRDVEVLVDIGVAGLHRLLAKVDVLRRAEAIVVVAGMDGALPGVVAGLVPAPVIAVPTSVGYGAAFDGLAPLLTMLNACAPGVAVVNIDNGYGAGHLAAQIAAPRG